MKKRLSALFLMLAMAFVITPGAAYAATVVSEIRLNCDINSIGLNKPNTEKTVHNLIYEKGSLDTGGLTIDGINTGLSYWSDVNDSISGIGDGDETINPGRQYYARYCIRLYDDYSWPDEVGKLKNMDWTPISKVSSLRVFFNGVRLNDIVLQYNTYHKTIYFFIPIGHPINAVLSASSFIYDGNAKKPGCKSVSLKTGAKVLPASCKVSYYDQKWNLATPVKGGKYYAVVRAEGQGIYSGFTVREFVIHEHTWDSGKVTKATTTEAAGIRTYTCTSCGETKTEAIEKLKITISKKPVIQTPAAKKTAITVRWKHFAHKTNKTRKIWKKIRKVQVQCASDRKFGIIVRTVMVGRNKTKAVIKGLKKNTVYFVRVRYYDGKGYSKWSKVKKIRTKKK